MNRQSDFEPCGFFLIRSPLLPISRDVAADDIADIAIRLASPTLADAMAGPDSSSARVRHAARRYYQRMSYRATPFGLFAGVSVGRIADQTEIEFLSRRHYTIRTRPDGEVLAHLWNQLARSAVADGRRLACNNTLLCVGRWYRFLAYDPLKDDRIPLTVTVQRDAVLDAVVDFTASPRSSGDVVRLVEHRAGVSEADARAYVSELAGRGVLVLADIPSPEHAFTRALAAGEILRNSDPLHDATRAYCSAVSAMDGVSVENLSVRQIEDVRAAAERLIGRKSPRCPINIVLLKPGRFTLASEIVDDIREAIDFLRKTTRPRPFTDANLQRFQEAFQARYEGAAVPLLEALDPDLGVPFTEASADVTAENVVGPFKENRPQEDRVVRAREELLLRRIRSLPSGQELTLTPEDTDALATGHLLPLPESFNLLCSLSRAAGGDWDVFVGGVGGPSGVRLMTRFAFASDELCELLRNVATAEAAAVAPSLLAEVVYVPGLAEHWNVSARPPLRAFEMPLLGVTSDGTARIDLQSLFVSVADGKVRLTTADGIEVRPRITSGHNYNHRNIPQLHKFLGALQTQEGHLPLEWSWGALEFETFLPRVRFGRVVFTRARWRLSAAEVAAEKEPRRLAAKLMAIGAPSRVLLDGLMVDLDSDAASQLLESRMRRRADEDLLVFECFPAHDSTAAHGPEGRFMFEIDLPFRRTTLAGESKAVAVARNGQRHFLPGDEWSFVKLYCAPRMADDLLALVIAPLVSDLLAKRISDQWFFIRYTDPQFHLRLRVRSKSGDVADILAMLRGMLQQNGMQAFVHRLVIDTYDREIERYGGAAGIEIAELLFHADSAATLEAIASGRLDGFPDKLAYATLAVEHLLRQTGLPLNRLTSYLESWLESLKRTMPSKPKDLRQHLARVHRENEAHIGKRNDLATLMPRRSELLRAPVAALVGAAQDRRLTTSLPDLLLSYCHMAVNRIFAQPAAAQDLFVYDSTRKRLQSSIARQATTAAC